MIIYYIYRWAFKEAVVKASGRVDLVYPEMYLEKNDLSKQKLF